VRHAEAHANGLTEAPVIDGDPIRGMAPYRSNSYVAENLDDIYRYFLARANGDIGPEYRPPAPSERR
jgi:cytochrome c55X